MVGETETFTNPGRLNGGDIGIANPAPRRDADFTAGNALFDKGNAYTSLVDGVTTGRHILPTTWFDGETFGDVTLHSGDSVNNLFTVADGQWGLKPNAPTASRSEEHTSELQSLMRISYAVFCLKNKKKTPDNRHHSS